jgi:hypothetical protein
MLDSFIVPETTNEAAAADKPLLERRWFHTRKTKFERKTKGEGYGLPSSKISTDHNSTRDPMAANV